jgi:hypothetical protein
LHSSSLKLNFTREKSCEKSGVFIPIRRAECTSALEKTYGISSLVCVSGKLQLNNNNMAVIVLVPAVGENIVAIAWAKTRDRSPDISAVSLGQRRDVTARMDQKRKEDWAK